MRSERLHRRGASPGERADGVHLAVPEPGEDLADRRRNPGISAIVGIPESLSHRLD